MTNKSQGGGRKRKTPSSTTSLGKRRRREPAQQQQQQQQQKEQSQQQSQQQTRDDQQMPSDKPRSSEYGSQASPFSRVAPNPRDPVKVAILGAAGGIGQPLSLLLMLHVEYVQHLALYDTVDSVHGVGLDVSHVDRQVRVTTHQGPDSLAEAVRGARVIVVPAGLAQKPGQSRDDLFAANAKIMLQLAKTCAQVAPDAALAIITNPVNSLVPIACETYARVFNATDSSNQTKSSQTSAAHIQPASTAPAPASAQTERPVEPSSGGPGSNVAATKSPDLMTGLQATNKQQHQQQPFEDCFRRIFGVTTLDVIRASSLTARSTLMADASGPADPSKVQVPVVGGHAGKTIMPLLSQATPRLDRKRLEAERQTTQALVESIQQAGIEVLNAKKGRGSATLAMAYAASRFTLALLRAQSGEQNVVECAYVRQPTPVFGDLEYFATPLLLGREGYVKSLGIGKTLMGYEQQMLEEGARELRLSIVRGEDYVREHI